MTLKRRKDDCEHRRGGENGLRAKLPAFEGKITLMGLLNFLTIVVGGGMIYFLEGRDFMRDTRREIVALKQVQAEAVTTQKELTIVLSDLRLVLVRLDQKSIEQDRRLGKLEGS